MSQFAVCVQPRVRKIGAFATSFGIINSTQQRIDLTRTSVQQNWRETDTERRFLKKKMERRRIFFSITLHVIISSVVQSCCDTSNGWVDITESSRVGDIIGNIQGHSMTSFKNVRVIFVLISHLFNKLKIHTTGCRRHWRCGFRRFLDFVLLEVCVFLEITIF